MSTPSSLATERPRVLLVEDDENLRVALTDNLRHEGYAVTAAADCVHAFKCLAERDADLILLDVMLPDGDGFGLCRRLRSDGVTAMILMLTARGGEADLLAGFEAGADDYLGKPFRLTELLARVRALLRRSGVGSGEAPPRQAAMVFGTFTFDRGGRQVLGADGTAVDLTRTEFDLLDLLLEQRNVALSRRRILDDVWGSGIQVDERTVDNFVSSLKKKLCWRPGAGFQIRTVRGVGYRMELDEPTGRD